ncbi:hypothetical protein BDQ17DRAFT_1548268, partial [Cyathus striatus]
MADSSVSVHHSVNDSDAKSVERVIRTDTQTNMKNANVENDIFQNPHVMLGRPYKSSRTTYIPSVYESDNEIKKFKPESTTYNLHAPSYSSLQTQHRYIPGNQGHVPYRSNQSIRSYSTFPESFIAVDPYRATIAPYAHRQGSTATKSQLGDGVSTDAQATQAESTLDVGLPRYIIAFLVQTVPRQLYLYFLLGLPSLYFSRVARIFEEAEMSLPEIRRMATETSTNDRFVPFIEPAPSTPLYTSFKATWESFIDSLMREWKTLNIVSVLLLSAILTLLQIGSAAEEPLTRYSALLSMICTLMSLLYGCMYIIRFNSMRKTYKAAQWAEEAQQTTTSVLWNVWVMLAMPAIWLSWAIVLYIVCIMSFVWRTGAGTDDPTPLTVDQALGPRILISVTLALGIIYFCLIMLTFRRYGDHLDMAWRERVISWSLEKSSVIYEQSAPPSSYKPSLYEYAPGGRNSDYDPSLLHEPSLNYEYPANRRSRTRSPRRKPDTGSNYTVPTSGRVTPDVTVPTRKPIKAMDLRFLNSIRCYYTSDLMKRGIRPEAWTKFLDDIAAVWDGKTDMLDVAIPMHNRRPQDLTGLRLDWWNRNLFFEHQLQAVLCLEYPKGYPESPLFAVYVIEHAIHDGFIEPIDQRFGQVPEDMERIDILDPHTATSYDTRRLNLGRTVLLAPDKIRAAGVRFGRSFDDEIIPVKIIEESGEESNDDGEADEEDNGTESEAEDANDIKDDLDDQSHDGHSEPRIYIRIPTPASEYQEDLDDQNDDEHGEPRIRIRPPTPVAMPQPQPSTDEEN